MTEPAPDYAALLEAWERRDGEVPHLHIERGAPRGTTRLLVTIATHNNGERYAALETAARHWKGDVLALRDPGNSYYLREDGGAGYDAVVDRVCDGYDPARTVFFGASMAGHAALRWALRRDANALVSNPQVNLDAAAELAWPELRRNIRRIPTRVNLDAFRYPGRSCALTWLHGQHPMDLDAVRRFLEVWLECPGMALRLQHDPEPEHRYLIRSGRHFLALLEATLAEREARDRLRAG